ncbi:hypothetical protein [Nocardiopsis sp. LOL_012]|uniref:hypothetical protein n=1 Tax=Nocardiopsis sp. LOL_012 TaxID=3345409 RepID=UPI003A84F785
MKNKLTLLFVFIVGFGSLAATPAAASGPYESMNVSPALDACINEAQDRELDSWLCLGGRLTTPDAEGITPDSPEGLGAPSETIAEDEVLEAPSGAARSAADDYDQWCEYASVCHRPISSYINETKGNAAFGNDTEVVGRFDVVIRTRLSGRTPFWSTTFIWEEGPRLHFNEARVQCREEEPLWPDTDCGMFMVDSELGRFEIGEGVTDYRKSFDSIRGNYLEDSGAYYADVEAYIWPEGLGPMGMPVLRSQELNCPQESSSNNRCTFPLE